MNILFKQTPNYQKGTQAKTGYVLHQTLGSYLGAVEWLMNGNRPNRSSAHYVIGRNEGEITQLVKDVDDSWHAGVISNPSEYAKKYLKKNLDGTYVNPNRYMIGIEFASRYDVDSDGQIEPQEIELTDWQYRAAIEIFKKNENIIPIKQDMMLISHKELADYKSDDTIFVRNELLKRMFPSAVPNDKEKIKQAIKLLESLL